MTVIEAVILGVVQGLTEFVPVSSSGHLVLVERLFAIKAPFVFASLINLGTFVALIVYFHKRLVQMTVDVIRHKNYKLARNIILSSLPVGLLGFFFEDFFAKGFIQHPLTVAIMLAVIGVLMIVVEHLPKLGAVKRADDLQPKQASLIGVVQALSLIPGTSRSGSTMIIGRMFGLNFKQAAEYSFLLSIPVMFGVLLKALFSSAGISFIQHNFLAFAVSNIVAFATGMFAVSFMLRYLAHGNFVVFGWYRLVLASAIIVVLLL